MERKIGVYICECGPNISEKVDIDKVVEAVSSLDGVSVAKNINCYALRMVKNF